MTIEEGDTVVWTNDDSEPHNVTADDGSFDSGSMGTGDTFSLHSRPRGFGLSPTLDRTSQFEGRVIVGAETSQTLPDAFNLDEDIYGTDKFNFVTKERTVWHPRAKRSLRS